ncbi:MAG TPA: hypothetical protein VGS60_03675 [Actinomycetes bacterium]|jgi:hypothetical protein|nr:hypothetical protein [Actinomycetes bacterium]
MARVLPTEATTVTVSSARRAHLHIAGHSELPLFADWARQVVEAMSGIEPGARGGHRNDLNQRQRKIK